MKGLVVEQETGADKAQAAVTQVAFAKKPQERPMWQFTKSGEGSYKLTDAKSGKGLAGATEETGSGARIAVQAREESGARKWELLLIDPKRLTM